MPEHYYPKPAPRAEIMPRIARAGAFVIATGAVIRHGGNVACYNVNLDYVQPPGATKSPAYSAVTDPRNR